jgi:hypothetical protein
MLQGCAVQKLHSNERLLTVLADFVDGANIGMIESRRRSRLPAKAFERLRVSRQFVGQKLEGDEPAKLGVLSLIDHTHAATTKLLDDAIVRNGLVNQWRSLALCANCGILSEVLRKTHLQTINLLRTPIPHH